MCATKKADDAEEAALAARTQGMRDEAAGLKSAQSSRLAALLKETEELVRQSVLLEAEIQHQTERRNALQEQLRTVRTSADETASEAAGLERQLADLRTQVEAADTDVAKLRKKVSDAEAAAEKMGAERDNLQKEADRLEKQKTRLEDDVKRLRKLREEYLQAIAQFREAKEELTS